MSAVTYTAQTQQAIGAAQFEIGGLKALMFGAVVALLGVFSDYMPSAAQPASAVATTKRW
jgi:ABC-type transporter Mla maintaining outer membrane lipid asymmetry permease subunit MlaE